MTQSAAEDFKQFERTGWTRAADAYRAAVSKVTAQAIEPLLSAVELAPGERFLDVACGPGDLSAAAVRRGARATGIDLSPAMVALAQRLHPEGEFREGDAESLPFEPGSFDAAAMSFCVGHVPDPDQAFREAHRVLARGGRYAFAWWAAPDEAVVFGIVYRAVEAHGRSDVPLPKGPEWSRFSVADECRRSLHTAGFGRVEVTRVPMTWRLDTPEQLVEIMRHATVRTAGLLAAQEPAALERISRAIAEEARRFAVDGGIELPMPCWVARGSKA